MARSIPRALRVSTVFLLNLGEALARGQRQVQLPPKPIVGINYIVWDPATRELSFRPDSSLEQHTSYALVVTTGVRDASGHSIGVAEGFRRFRHDLAHDPDRYYRRALLSAEWAVGRAVDVPHGVEVAALSVFTTQTATHIMERIRDAVQAAPAPAIDFGVGPSGSRAVFSVASLQSVTFNAHLAASGPLTPQPLANFIVNMNTVPGAVASVAFGRFTALDFTMHPSGHIAPIATRTGTLAPTGTVEVGVTVWLPSGPRPATGWPVEICAHGASGNKNFCVSQSSIANSRGIAVIAINAMGHGNGPLSTMALRRTDGTTVTVAAPGSGYDHDGNGTIDMWEPRFAPRPHAVWGTSGTVAETAGMHLQLVRALQAGVDVEGDGATDLDASRIYFMGHSLGVAWGEMVFAYEPAIRAAAFVAGPGTLAYLRPLSPAFRSTVGQHLAARTPSLVNSAYGLTSIDGVAVTAPFYNEGLPLRDEPPLTNPVPGAIAIQRVFDHNAWAEQIASGVAFAPLLRRAPPPGVPARPFIHQFARSDRQSVNPGTGELARAGDFADRAGLLPPRPELRPRRRAGRPALVHHSAAAGGRLRARRDRRAASDRDVLRKRWRDCDAPVARAPVGGADPSAASRRHVLSAALTWQLRLRRPGRKPRAPEQVLKPGLRSESVPGGIDASEAQGGGLFFIGPLETVDRQLVFTEGRMNQRRRDRRTAPRGP